MKNAQTQVWQRVRLALIGSQKKHHFRGGIVDFDRVDRDPDYIDIDRLLGFIGIEVLDEYGAARCFCGNLEARWNRSNRRFMCPKESSGGCSIYWVDPIRLVQRWVQAGRPKPSSRPSLPSKTGNPGLLGTDLPIPICSSSYFFERTS